MAQLTFKWPVEASYAQEDFIRSPANQQAAEFLVRWPGAKDTPVGLLTGPEASGKSHLAHIWEIRTGAKRIAAKRLGTDNSAELWQNAPAALLEDIHDLRDETSLFHLIRYAESQRLALLLTSRKKAGELSFNLPDLCSRLLAAPGAAIQSPDDMLLRHYLRKYFADRQLRVGEEVTDYLVRRTERSFSAVSALAQRVEAEALAARRDITIPFLKHFSLS